MADQNEATEKLISKWKKLKHEIKKIDLNSINVVLDSLKAKKRPAESGLRELEKLKDLIFETEKNLRGEVESITEPPPTKPIDSESEPTQIENFFETVGQGLINAQTQLDRQSVDYIMKKPVQIQPTIYKIPKVNAEIHFAIEKSKKKGFNVLIYGSSEEHRKEQQHKVSFDIVAAPPPPDIAQKLQKINIGGFLLADPISRKIAKQALKSYHDKHRQSPEIEKNLLKQRIHNYLESFSQVILIQAETIWALILPGKKEGEKEYNFDVIYLVVGDEKFDIVDDFKSDAAEPKLTKLKRLNKFSAILAQISAQQDRVLKELKLDDDDEREQ